jgi:Mg-chelatase subunit ChlD
MKIEKNTIKIKTTNEYSEAISKKEVESYQMISIICPDIYNNETEKRQSIDLLAVIDKSGSMEGEKLKLIKTSLDFIVEQLTEKDKFSLVCFDSEVKVEFDFLQMNGKNKTIAKETIGKITSGFLYLIEFKGSATNLSGGLFKGYELFQKREEVSEISTMLLFTDGLANKGVVKTQGKINILKTKDIVKGITNMNKKLEKKVNLYTFGFGSDHDANSLREMSQNGEGMYYYVEKEENISDSFADCLGGILSIFSQNTCLKIELLNNTKLVKNLTPYINKSTKNDVLEFHLGDLISEEKKDLILVFNLEKLESEVLLFDVFKATITYFNTVEMNLDTITHTSQIIRPNYLSENLIVSLELDCQRNRILTAENLKISRNFADMGKLKEAKNVLDDSIETLKKSPSKNMDFTLNLLKDLEECLKSMVDKEVYQNHGNKMMNNLWQMQYLQKSTKNEKFSSNEAYDNQCKKNMRSKNKGF